MRRLTVLLVVALVGLAALAALAARGGDESGGAGGVTATATAGEVDVEATVRSGAGVAVIHVVFDTHSVELDFDPVEIATLDVGGWSITPSSWDGDGPGGHHREVDLTFDEGGAPADMTLTLALDPPVTIRWGET